MHFSHAPGWYYAATVKTGILTKLATTGCWTRPMKVIVSPDNKNVYTANRDSHDTGMWSRNTSTGAITLLGVLPSALYNPTSLCISADGLFVYTACDGSNESLNGISVSARNPSTGVLTAVSALDIGFKRPQGICLSPDGNYIYVASFTTASILTFSRNSTTGAVALVGTATTYSSPISMSMSPDGNNLYTIGYYDRVVSVHTRNAATGAVSAATQSTVVGSSGHTVEDITVSGDGKSVYTATQYGVTMFTRDAATGNLTLLGVYTGGLNQPGGVCVSPDNTNVYVTNIVGNNITQLIRGTTGGLTYNGNIASGGQQPRGIAVSPNGDSVYAVNYYDSSITAFSRY